jgi:hypothetical protein
MIPHDSSQRASMKLIPKDIYAQYIQWLKRSNIPAGLIQEYIKWLRYFLDFCEKHVIAHEKSERLRLFLEKLREKGQSENQCQRAVHAVSPHPPRIRPSTLFCSSTGMV